MILECGLPADWEEKMLQAGFACLVAKRDWLNKFIKAQRLVGQTFKNYPHLEAPEQETVQ